MTLSPESLTPLVLASISGDIGQSVMSAVGSLAAILTALLFAVHLENVGYDGAAYKKSRSALVICSALVVSTRMTISYLAR